MDLSVLSDYLRNRFAGRQSLMVSEFHDITSGWETHIYSFNLKWISGEGSEQEDLVARVYARGTCEKAQQESTVMKQLLKIGYPVPRIHITETDESILGQPFIIMDRINGATLEDLISLPGADISKWVNVFSHLFVDLHNLDWTRFVSNPDGFPKDDPYFIIKSTLANYRDLLDRYGHSELLPIFEWLKDHANRVPCSKPSFTHGDFHPMNILIDENEKPYVIDWGASMIRDFRADLAWTLLLTRAYSTQENRDTILDGYQRASGATVKDIDYFEVLAILRRLFDVSVSLNSGATSRGMRDGAIELMKEQMGHVSVVYELLGELTGIRIPKVEDWINSFT
jgi:aminoglycoside phosphotransferase (APT) family kinase protein